jgi:hypothetical protein
MQCGGIISGRFSCNRFTGLNLRHFRAAKAMLPKRHAAELQQLLHFLPLEQPRFIDGWSRNERDSFQESSFIGIAGSHIGHIAQADDTASDGHFAAEVNFRRIGRPLTRDERGSEEQTLIGLDHAQHLHYLRRFEMSCRI